MCAGLWTAVPPFTVHCWQTSVQLGRPLFPESPKGSKVTRLNQMSFMSDTMAGKCAN